MKIIYGYNYHPAGNTYGDTRAVVYQYLDRIKSAGYDIEPFCLSIDPPSYHLPFQEIDKKWKKGDKKLLALYEELERAVEGKDVFFNAPGIHLHPKFVEKLPVFTVFGCNDDPESSKYLSEPVASSYDLCLIGNIAEIETYKRWGVKNVNWLPLGLQPQIYDTSLTYEKILNGERDIDLFMMIDKLSPWRLQRMLEIEKAFPDAHFYGQGWSRGYLPKEKQLEYLSRAKIGPNFHNSTGPINFRLFYLPANGVMQICDNKSYLGKIYELGKEVAGFDTVNECIDLCKYYLAHDEERRKIAAEGWKRAITDYNEIAVFENYFIKEVKKHLSIPPDRKTDNAIVVHYAQKNKSKFLIRRIVYFICYDLVLRNMKRCKRLIKTCLRFTKKAGFK